MLKKSLLVAAAALAAGSPAEGFGLRSHLWISEQVLDDLADCRLTIAGEEFDVPRETCDALRADPARFRANFMAGAVGPDAFPDLVVGQSIIHPGAYMRGGQWLGAESWLDRLLSTADQPEEIAFAWGYAMHYAGDTFAHSYVNNYAGDVFELFSGGTPNVELRHFRLEKYLDQFLQYQPNVHQLSVPARFVARQLILFDYSQIQGVSLLATAHMRTMRAALELAAEARARAPDLEAQSRARVERAGRQLRRIEDEMRVPPSGGAPIDRRMRPDHISSGQWRRLRAAHEQYEDEVDRANRDRGLVRFTAAWAADVETTFEHYIAASLAFGRNMAAMGGTSMPYQGRHSMLQPYRDWFRCYGNVLRGVPIAVGDATCAHIRELGSDIDFGEAALRATAGSRASSLYLDLLNFNRWVQRRLASLAISVATIADRNVARLVREVTDPAHISGEALNSAFEGSDNGQLAFRCVQDWIDSDLGLFVNAADRPTDPGAACNRSARRRLVMDPHQFLPLAYAVTLAKLSLLDQAGVRAVAARFGGIGDAAALRLSERRRYSVLLDAVRSLDGSHQWQPVSLPFPRRMGARPRPFVTAGYGGQDGPATGFPFYQTESLRRRVFSRLFPVPFEGRILERAEMRWPLYRFRPCDGDPLRVSHPDAEMVGCPDDRLPALRTGAARARR